MPERDGQKTPGVKRRQGARLAADQPVGEAKTIDATMRSPTTASGLPVEEQIRKEWNPKKDGGLPNSLARWPR